MRLRRSGPDRLLKPPPSDWNSEVSSAYAMAGFLFVIFIGFTLLVMGPWLGIDAYFNVRKAPHGWLPVLHVLDRVGQRAICLPLLGVALVWVWRKRGRVRQFFVGAIAVFMLNLIVLILKVGLGRGQPGSMNPDFFVGGMAYPSGHTSNIILVYGLIPYVLAHYGGVRPRIIKLWAALVGFLAIWMVAVSLTLKWHWFGDLFAGLMIGGMTLALTSAVDHAIPNDTFDDGLIAGLKRVPRLVFRERHFYNLKDVPSRDPADTSGSRQ